MFDQVALDTLFSIPQRNGLTKPKRLRGEGVKMVNMGELFSERRIQDMTMDRVPCSERELESNKLEDGDLLFARQFYYGKDVLARRCALWSSTNGGYPKKYYCSSMPRYF